MGKVLQETAHTITFLPKIIKKEVVLSKRDDAKDTTEQTGTSRQVEIPQISTEEETTNDETYVMSEDEEDEENLNIQKR